MASKNHDSLDRLKDDKLSPEFALTNELRIRTFFITIQGAFRSIPT